MKIYAIIELQLTSNFIDKYILFHVLDVYMHIHAYLSTLYLMARKISNYNYELPVLNFIINIYITLLTYT